ncbi:MAG: hypothetical protein WDO15_00085 [Bacteroidota bacterium]
MDTKWTFIVEKSQDILSGQIESKRALQNAAGVILGFISVFFSVFISVIEKADYFIKVLSIAPLIFLVFGLVRLIQVLRTNDLFQGSNVSKLESLIQASELEIARNELALNKRSVEKNIDVMHKMHGRYNDAILLIGIAVIVATILLFVNIFIPNGAN